MYHHLEFNNASPFSPNWGSFFAELPFNSLIFSKIFIQNGNVLHMLCNKCHFRSLAIVAYFHYNQGTNLLGHPLKKI